MTTTLNPHPAVAPAKRGRSKRPLLHRLHCTITDGDIAVITFDNPDKSVNVFDHSTLDELDLALNVVTSLKPRGVVFVSAKPSVFIAGADVHALASASESELERVIDKGQRIFERISELPFPTVAAVHGACLGGGLEMALACDMRIASDARETRLGLPETQLGIIPAWGGSSRLPRLIGPAKALKLILSGKRLTPQAARRQGVIDSVVPRERLESYAAKLIDEEASSEKKQTVSTGRLCAAAMRWTACRKVMKRTRGNYPALLAAVEVVTRSTEGSMRDSLRREKEAVMRLARTDATRNLLRVFELVDRARRFRHDPGVDRTSLPVVERTAVIGAGVMGSGMAQWFSARGKPVVLQDVSPEKVAEGIGRVCDLYRKAVKRKIFTKREARQSMDLVSPVADPVPLHHCDLVVEAAVESMELKQKIFADLCSRSSESAILATNTSALSVKELCEAPGVTHPERIVGLHFFNPVNRMRLVEVVVTNYTSPEVVEQVLAFVRDIGKVPVVVKDSPGFLVNRILMPYLAGAGRLVDEGYSPEEIDEAMLDYGMPMGPLRLLDEIGLDVAAHVADTMAVAFGERFAIPDVLGRLRDSGCLGRKSGRGFFQYEKGKPISVAVEIDRSLSMPRAVIAEHLSNLMIEEAQRCLDEGLVTKADEIDLAMILGSGYAPFRGGPLRDAKTKNRK